MTKKIVQFKDSQTKENVYPVIDASVTEQLSNLNININSINSSLNAAETNIINCSNNIGALKKQIKDVSIRISDASIKIDKDSSSIRIINNVLQITESSVFFGNGRITVLNADPFYLESSILMVNRNQLRKDYKSLETIIKSIEDRLTALESK